MVIVYLFLLGVDIVNVCNEVVIYVAINNKD